MNRIIRYSLFALLFLPTLFYGQCITNYASNSGLSGVANTAIWTGMPNVRNAPDGSGVRILTFVPMDPGRSTSIVGVWDFGLDIPCNATIDDLSFTFTRRNAAATGSVIDETIQLKFGDFTFSSVDAATGGTWMNSTSAWETITYNPAGGWGSTLTPDMLNDPLFGLIFTAENTSATEVGWPEVDAIEIEVCYTVVGTPYSTLDAVVTSTSDNLCDPAGNAQITFTASGGTGTYEYSIDAGQTWSANPVFASLISDTYFPMVRDTDFTCGKELGPLYIGCYDSTILQVGDAIYTCLPTGADPVTLAIDRIQPLHDFYQNGQVYDDVSDQLQQKAYSWTSGQLGGPVFGVAVDENHNIYTGVSALYNLITTVPTGNLIAIDAVTGVPSVIATVPGTMGSGQIEYQEGCGQLFVTNLDDGMIYRYSTAGALLSSFDPLNPDDGIVGLSPLGERVVGLAFNYAENRLYYSVWSNDQIDNGTRNTIRSIAIDPATCDFLPGTDMLEVTMPFISETELSSNDYSMPVLDIEFDAAGGIMLLAESGFNSTIPVNSSHLARVLRYDGATSSWTSVNVPPTGNQDYQYEIGDINDGTNSLGGIDFGYAGINSTGCVAGEGEFIVATGDALKGVDCTFYGCVYGLQYIPIAGGNPTNSVIVDLARSPDSQQKGFFGDVDVVGGCCPCACPIITFDISTTDNNLCAGDQVTLCIENEAGGIPAYTYEWGTTETIACIDVMPSATTTYMATVTDDNGCTAENSLEILISPEITISNVAAVDDSDCTNSNGSITITASGGTAPLMYSVDGGLAYTSSGSFSGLGAGSYNIIVQDASGCSQTDSATLDGPSAITITDLAIVNDMDCSNPNGSITISASGGTPPLMFSQDNGATFVSAANLTGLSAGTYSLVVQDATGCSVTSSATVDGPASLSGLSIDTVDDTDCVTNNGSITINVSGGNPPLSYSIDGGLTFSASNVFSALPAGLYSTVINDAFDCSIANTVELFGNASLTYSSVAVDDSDCVGDDGSIAITVSGGTMPYMYSIDGGVTFTTNSVFSSLPPGTYDIVVNDALSCTAGEDGVIIGAPICGGSVGDRVWEDLDGNGIQDPGEPSIPNVKVELYNGNGNLVGIMITDNNGEYLFDDVAPGDYYIRFVDIDGYDQTIANIGGNSSSDSDVDNTNGPNTTPTFTLSPGEDDRSRDFGVYKCVPLGELVWFDVNENGIADNGENGINGLKVEIFKQVGNFWIKTDIDYTGHKPGAGSDDGYFKFCVSPGEYYVKFNNPPDRLVRTRSNSGSDITRDSDITESFGPGTTDSFFVESGDEKCDIGAGFVPAGTIGDFVWIDNNNDGRRGVTEAGLPGVEVQAINRHGEMVAHAVTNDEGRYMLDMLPQDKYYVQFNLPEGYALTVANMGDENLDSDVDDSNGPNTTPVYDVRPGQHVESVDAGVVLSVLPVKWVSVRAEEKEAYNHIEWIIESEINVSHYEVEHSFDTTDAFDKIGKKDSDTGTYSGRLVYDFDHSDAERGTNYYRVKQIDLDGRFTYSKTVSVNNTRTLKAQKNQIKVYPNPVLAELNIGIDLIRNTNELSVNIYDNLGKKVAGNLVLDVNLNAGYKLYSVDITRIPQGVYSLEIIIDDSVVVKKVAITN